MTSLLMSPRGRVLPTLSRVRIGDGATYRYTGTRGASRIRLHDGELTLSVGDSGSGTSGSTVTFKEVFYASGVTNTIRFTMASLEMLAGQQITASGLTKYYSGLRLTDTGGNLAFQMYGDDATDRISFQTDYGNTGTWTERMAIIAQTGNVGIGTTTPGALLDVQGAAQFGTGNVNLITSAGKIAGLSTTYFQTDTSANLAGIITDETGSGALVFGTSPTITTPTIGTSLTLGADTISDFTGTGLTVSGGALTVSGVPASSLSLTHGYVYRGSSANTAEATSSLCMLRTAATSASAPPLPLNNSPSRATATLTARLRHPNSLPPPPSPSLQPPPPPAKPLASSTSTARRLFTLTAKTKTAKTTSLSDLTQGIKPQEETAGMRESTISALAPERSDHWRQAGTMSPLAMRRCKTRHLLPILRPLAIAHWQTIQLGPIPILPMEATIPL
ncbi:MAG: hypothetical protein KatS3mg099_129 [Candidatus Parcubacteria bacterium]|nr:MAG: hypothetical protein KatS3mg099_129 [Candidatus Parcubacteria bacterium]